MSISISVQVTRFFLSCTFGIVLAFAYDLMRILRRSVRDQTVVTFLTDALYSVFALVSFTIFVLVPCEGDIRLFLVIGSSLGMALYFLTVSVLVLRCGDFIVRMLKTLGKIIMYPFLFLKKQLLMHRQKRRNGHGSHKQKKESG